MSGAAGLAEAGTSIWHGCSLDRLIGAAMNVTSTAVPRGTSGLGTPRVTTRLNQMFPVSWSTDHACWSPAPSQTFTLASAFLVLGMIVLVRTDPGTNGWSETWK